VVVREKGVRVQQLQFFFGLEAVGFPLLVYVLLKRRENRSG
jgi:hypothetical protein